jgi:hypothetical protein
VIVCVRGASAFAAFVSFAEQAGVPPFVLRVDIAEPEVAIGAMHGSRLIARLIVAGDTLAPAVRAFMMFGWSEHGWHPLGALYRDPAHLAAPYQS